MNEHELSESIRAHEAQQAEKEVSADALFELKEKAFNLIDGTFDNLCTFWETIDRFDGALDPDIAVKLIKTDYSGVCGNYAEILKFLISKCRIDQSVLAELLSKEKIEIVVENISRFEGVDPHRVISVCIEHGGYQRGYSSLYIAEHLDDFHGYIDKKTALALIENNYAQEVADHIEEFGELDGEVLRQLMYSYGRKGQKCYDRPWSPWHNNCDNLATGLSSFERLKKEIALQLVEEGCGAGSAVLDLIERVEEISFKEAVMDIFRSRDLRGIEGHLRGGAGLDKEVLTLLLDICEDLNRKRIIAHEAREKGYNSDKSLEEEFLKLGAGEGTTNRLLQEIMGKCEGLDAAVAERVWQIDEVRAPYLIADNVHRFSGIDLRETARRLINWENGNGIDAFGRNIEKFHDVLDQKLATDLVSRGAGSIVVSNLEKWSEVDLSKLALQLIREKQGSVVVDNFHIFKSLGEQTVANALIAAGEIYALAGGIYKFPNIDHKAIAEAFIKEGDGWTVANNLTRWSHEDWRNVSNFKNLDRSILLSLLQVENADVSDLLEAMKGDVFEKIDQNDKDVKRLLLSRLLKKFDDYHPDAAVIRLGEMVLRFNFSEEEIQNIQGRKDTILDVLQGLLHDNNSQTDWIKSILHLRKVMPSLLNEFPKQDVADSIANTLKGNLEKYDDYHGDKGFFEFVDREILGGALGETMQRAYHELFESYIKTHWVNERNEYDVYDGERELDFFSRIARESGIAPAFSKDSAERWYEFCVQGGKPYHQKIGVIADVTGHAPTAEFVEKNFLLNKEFSESVPVDISTEKLDAHFAKGKNKTLWEYQRIYKVFGCWDYYQRVIEEFESDASLPGKRDTIELLAAMGVRDIDNDDRYEAIREKLLSFLKDDKKVLNKSLAESLAALAEAGDSSIVKEFEGALRLRSKGAEKNPKPRTLIGFSGEEMVALRTLCKVDTTESNEALFELLFTGDLDRRVKKIILNNLHLDKKEFFLEGIREWLDASSQESSESVGDALQFFRAILKIPSADIREKSLLQAGNAFEAFSKSKLNPVSLRASACPDIPQDTFLQAWALVNGDTKLLAKIDELYGKARTGERNDLLFAVVNGAQVSDDIRNQALRSLKNIEFAPEEIAEFSSVLRSISFLDVLSKSVMGDVSKILKRAFFKPVASLSELHDVLKNVALESVKTVFPNEEITAEKIEVLWAEWGNLEPLFTYAGKMSSSYQDMAEFLGEMVAHMDPPGYKNWKEWRYDTQNPIVKEQIGLLSDSQLEIWKKDHSKELGEVLLSTTPSEKPKQIAECVEEAVRHSHIAHPDISGTERYSFIQKSLEKFLRNTETNASGAVTAENRIGALRKDMNDIDAVLRYFEKERIERFVTLLQKSSELPVNAKTKNEIGFLGQFLRADEDYKALVEKYASAEKRGDKNIAIRDLCPSNFTDRLLEIAAHVEQDYHRAKGLSVFGKHGLNIESRKETGQIYKKREDLNALFDICRLMNLDARRVALNKMAEKEGGGATITGTLEGLEKYFKNSAPFLQDLQNIRSVLGRKDAFGTKRRLAMLVTDNPQMVLQVGKYPIGNSSCQNYEGDPGLNRALAAYVADAHQKAVFVIDINKLHLSKEEINEKGFEKALQTINPQDMIEASIGRAVVKVVTRGGGSGDPTLFLEPTYSSVTKSDTTMDGDIERFLDLVLATPMKVRVCRGGGDESVRVAKSRNPEGQYEDGSGGNAENAGLGIQEHAYHMPAHFVL